MTGADAVAFDPAEMRSSSVSRTMRRHHTWYDHCKMVMQMLLMPKTHCCCHSTMMYSGATTN